MGRVARTLLTLVIAAAFVPSAGAQETSIAFTLGPGFVRFNDFGSRVNRSQQRQGGVRMTAGLRALQFATPISGARQLVLPGVGIRF